MPKHMVETVSFSEKCTESLSGIISLNQSFDKAVNKLLDSLIDSGWEILDIQVNTVMDCPWVMRSGTVYAVMWEG